MDKDEMQTAEGRLLEEAVRAARRSMRDVAKHLDISDTRLRHIVNGYQPVGRGQVIEIVAPPHTLARIAGELRVTPEQLDAVGRQDAAEVLRHIRAEEKKKADADPWFGTRGRLGEHNNPQDPLERWINDVEERVALLEERVALIEGADDGTTTSQPGSGRDVNLTLHVPELDETLEPDPLEDAARNEGRPSEGQRLRDAEDAKPPA